jgi:hypothetical protein
MSFISRSRWNGASFLHTPLEREEFCKAQCHKEIRRKVRGNTGTCSCFNERTSLSRARSGKNLQLQVDRKRVQNPHGKAEPTIQTYGDVFRFCETRFS